MIRRLLILLLLVALVAKPISAEEITRDTAATAIAGSEAVISQMQQMGFGVTYANDTLNEAKLLLLQTDT